MLSSLENSMELLQEFEAAHGTLRLDLGAVYPEEKDPLAATNVKRLFGLTESLRAIDMFEPILLGAVRNAALEVLDDQKAVFDSIAFGWSSTPVLNACAIKRRLSDTTGIVVNIQLSNFLTAVNALTWQLEQAMLRRDETAYQHVSLTCVGEIDLGKFVMHGLGTSVVNTAAGYMNGFHPFGRCDRSSFLFRGC